jgi:hypothetical protein
LLRRGFFPSSFFFFCFSAVCILNV